MSRPAPSEVEPTPETVASAPERVAEPTPGGAMGPLSILLGLLWIAGTVCAALYFFGLDWPLRAPPLELAAVACGIILPAMMVWFAGASVREAARSRAEARRLADAADRLLAPTQTAELGAKRLANTIRSEMATLEKMIETTLSRLRDVEGMITQQTTSVESMSQKAKSGAAQMILGMDRERAELLKISHDLNAQAQTIGDSISRHTQVIAEAARLAEAEVRAADKALEVRISSFGAAASLITDRTLALDGAAKSSADSALKLEHALSNALDILARATDLTDAARQSADAASIAASETAGAVRDTTSRAIDDARRAAELIRGEAGAVERDAEAALEKLRDAALAARDAAAAARSAAEARERGRGPSSYGASPARQAAPQAYEPPPQPSRRPPQTQNWDEQDWHEETRRAPEPPARPRQPERQNDSLFGEPDAVPPAPRAPAAPQGGAWTWRDLLSNVDDAETARAPEPRAPSGRERRPAPSAEPEQVYRPVDVRTAPSLPAADLIEHAGVRLNEVFSASALDRIAHRARTGTHQRRRAVKDAAPEAVRHLHSYLARDPAANQEAMAFLRSEGARIAELLARGRAAMGSDATRAFLLLDAAAG